MHGFASFILLYIYWAITALMGGTLLVVLFKEKDRSAQAVAALLLVPVILRLLLIK